MSVRLYVGNLPKEPIERQALQAVFAELGDSVTTKVIKDRKTGKCRGFAFVTVPNDEMADQFIEKYNGQAFMDSPLKIEKALPRTKGKGKEEASEGSEASETDNVINADNVEAQTEKETVKEKPKTLGRKNNTNNKKRKGATGGGYKPSGETEGFQPDPRWAAELAKLKEMLAAQTTNS